MNEFYENRDKDDAIQNFLQFTPLMYWCAFKRPVLVGAKDYDPSKDILEIVTKPLIGKLKKAVRV